MKNNTFISQFYTWNQICSIYNRKNLPYSALQNNCHLLKHIYQELIWSIIPHEVRPHTCILQFVTTDTHSHRRKTTLSCFQTNVNTLIIYSRLYFTVNTTFNNKALSYHKTSHHMQCCVHMLAGRWWVREKWKEGHSRKWDQNANHYTYWSLPRLQNHAQKKKNW